MENKKWTVVQTQKSMWPAKADKFGVRKEGYPKIFDVSWQEAYEYQICQMSSKEHELEKKDVLRSLSYWEDSLESDTREMNQALKKPFMSKNRKSKCEDYYDSRIMFAETRVEHFRTKKNILLLKSDQKREKNNFYIDKFEKMMQH